MLNHRIRDSLFRYSNTLWLFQVKVNRILNQRCWPLVVLPGSCRVRPRWFVKLIISRFIAWFNQFGFLVVFAKPWNMHTPLESLTRPPPIELLTHLLLAVFDAHITETIFFSLNLTVPFDS